MAGRSTRGRKAVNFEKTFQNVSTQTSPSALLEISDFKQNEIDRLTKRLDFLEKQLNPVNRNEDTIPVLDRQREENIVVAAADSPQAPKISGKGCGCKGKCASKVCGCVKKKIPCTSDCKCTHKHCKNQEGDKENTSKPKSHKQVSSKPEVSVQPPNPRKTRNRILEEVTAGAAGPSNQRLDQVSGSQKSIFSPETTPKLRNWASNSALYLNETVEFPSNPKKRVVFESEADLSPLNKPREKKRAEDTHSLKVTDEKSTRANKTSKSDELNEKRLISPYRQPGDVSNSHISMRRKQVGDKETAQKSAASKSSDSESERTDDEVKRSPAGVTHRLKVTDEKSTRANRGPKSNESNERRLISPYRKTDDIANPQISTRRKQVEDEQTPQKSAESKRNDSESEKTDDEFQNLTIDPMKPTRQLQRTPVALTPRRISTSRSDIESPLPPPRVTLKEDRIIIPQPRGVEEPNIDWDEHRRQLLPCKHCKRTFYPFRLQKHEANCKKV